MENEAVHKKCECCLVSDVHSDFGGTKYCSNCRSYVQDILKEKDRALVKFRYFKGQHMRMQYKLEQYEKMKEKKIGK